jgi:hypothetical protein
MMDPNDPAVRAKHAAIAGSPRHGKQVCVVVSLGDDKDIESCRGWPLGALAKPQKAEEIVAPRKK